MKKLFLFFSLIFGMIITENINAQVSNPTNNWSLGAYAGWNTANNLDFNLGNPSITYMSLLTSGDLNITNAVNGYKIDTNFVLRHAGDIENIFVGVGTAWSNTGSYNSFIDY